MSTGRLSVLHVAQPVDGGCGRYVADLARDQTARGFDVVVAGPASGWLPQTLNAAGVRHETWNATRSPGPSVPGETASLRRIVRRTRPDVLHLHSSKAGLAGRLTRTDARVVFQPHAWSFHALSGALARAAVLWERSAARRTNAVICVSEREREAGEDAGIDARYVVIPNGVDVERVRSDAPLDQRAARLALRLPDRPTVVCVGRVSRQKGQDVLLRAWPEVRARVPEALLVLVGRGTDRLVADEDGVLGVGPQGTTAAWLAAADVVAVPSRWEGMSLLVLEALAIGRSLVATDAAGNAEAIGEEAGAIVPVEAPNALAAAIAERLERRDLRLAEGMAAAKRAHRYDLGFTQAAVADLYRAVAGLA